MDLVAGRKLDGIMCGKILIDGLVPADLPSLIAYVQSTDVHIGEFTVLENLYFAARLRLGSMCSAEECLRRCTEVAESLGLESALQVLVGSDLVKGISGGQKKRLSIGIELLAVPYILCLDEPTTGWRSLDISHFVC
jgi:ATP-binding cassette, subfamily G (WHITE), member 2